MVSNTIILVTSLIVLYAASQLRAFQLNIARAKASGFVYTRSPIYFLSIPWILSQEPLLPLLRKLPDRWTESWLPLSLFYRIWHSGYAPFEKAGEDSIMHVSPTGNVLWTCDPELIAHVMTRNKEFLKPVELMAILNLYGPTITASEGEEHRLYRKLAAPAFDDSTHEQVWSTSLEQARLMLDVWEEEKGIVRDIDVYSKRFALHVLSALFFNKNMAWAGDEEPPAGHELTYTTAISNAFKYNDVLFTTPRPVLSTFTFQTVTPVSNMKLTFSRLLAFTETQAGQTSLPRIQTVPRRNARCHCLAPPLRKPILFRNQRHPPRKLRQSGYSGPALHTPHFRFRSAR